MSYSLLASHILKLTLKKILVSRANTNNIMKKVFISLVLVFTVITSKAQTLIIPYEMHDSIVFDVVAYPLLVEDISLYEVTQMFEPDTIKFGIRGKGFIWGDSTIESKEQIMLLCRFFKVNNGSRRKSIRQIKKKLGGIVIVLYNVKTKEEEYTFTL